MLIDSTVVNMFAAITAVHDCSLNTKNVHNDEQSLCGCKYCRSKQPTSVVKSSGISLDMSTISFLSRNTNWASLSCFSLLWANIHWRLQASFVDTNYWMVSGCWQVAIASRARQLLTYVQHPSLLIRFFPFLSNFHTYARTLHMCTTIVQWQTT